MASKSNTATRSSVSRKRKEKARVDRFNHNVVEGDGLFFFKCRSVASTLKPLFSRYQSLTAENQALRGYSSNGILDLTNQKEIKTSGVNLIGFLVPIAQNQTESNKLVPNRKHTSNWGETVPYATAAIKRVNNGNKSHAIGCKVDGRARQRLLWIIVESKCTLDDIVMFGKVKDKKHVFMYSMQIYGLQAEVCNLKFVDRGFYVNVTCLDLSLMNNLKGFSDNTVKWVQ
ncbi:hypothetical protein EDC94DRAFT_579618 [Helicostylum pulchrum]|nr:hypothetical protein EDC94DRAFT_579618 [Helicostylum pulchrum]